ncbi:restriction endonuclease [Variovorax sp. J22R133]|uniref:restriction endonuclease n=1 Tax=Variovorax brevis TaxID=3053503 RepID=UPI0025769E4E|nr:restriction endonuclease [Variovorax sp. J22R133]MDM0113521.1 restriction endonuclease [Variovorax sp. J22R133]
MTGNSTRKPKTKTLHSLRPDEFENLVFDLMVSRGMHNVCWRTPGADGGRDIEGQSVHRDFSGSQTIDKWFVECKRYKSSVDWPTIHPKLAYADSMQADYLLLCTSSKFTPAATTQADTWNAAKRKPYIRLWPHQELLLQLRPYPDLLVKYGLEGAVETPGPSILAIALALSKAVSSHYSRLIFQDSSPDRMIQAAQSLADLLKGRIQDLERQGRIAPIRGNRKAQEIEGVVFSGNFFELDELALSALLAYLAALLPKSKITATDLGDGLCKIESDGDISQVVERYRSTFQSVALWGDIEYSEKTNTILLRQRA